MKTFQCTRLRLCNYLMDRGFFPYRVEPDKNNPRYRIYLFEETQALTAAVVRYFSVDCYTAKKTLHGGIHNDELQENRPSNPDRHTGGAESL